MALSVTALSSRLSAEPQPCCDYISRFDMVPVVFEISVFVTDIVVVLNGNTTQFSHKTPPKCFFTFFGGGRRSE